LEKQLNVSEFCGCPDTPKFEFIERREGEADTVVTSVADSCEQCCQPIGKQTIIINYVKSQKPDWMSDEEYAAAYA
jgi:formate-dependent phosphoribosylglycinamide formyltransferase (GAR transformylase)